jgi:hypothetical protein
VGIIKKKNKMHIASIATLMNLKLIRTHQIIIQLLIELEQNGYLFFVYLQLISLKTATRSESYACL